MTDRASESERHNTKTFKYCRRWRRQHSEASVQFTRRRSSEKAQQLRPLVLLLHEIRKGDDTGLYQVGNQTEEDSSASDPLPESFRDVVSCQYSSDAV